MSDFPHTEKMMRKSTRDGLIVGILGGAVLSAMLTFAATKSHYDKLNDISWKAYDRISEQLFSTLKQCGEKCGQCSDGNILWTTRSDGKCYAADKPQIIGQP